jgi:glutaredoxin 3
MDKRPADVVVYGAEWCAYCHLAMDYLKGKKVEYRYVDIDKEPGAGQEIFNKTGQAGVPVIQIADETILGFDRPRIDGALRANNLVS